MKTFRQIAMALATMLAVASCAPTSMDPRAQVVKYLEARDSINDCGDSSFTNESSSGSPTVSDCLQIATNIAGGGTWVYLPKSDFLCNTICWQKVPQTFALIAQHQLVQYGTCAFGVTAGYQIGVAYVKIGNQDIIDLIHSSIDKFQWNGLVGAKGELQCQTNASFTLKTSWGLYHTWGNLPQSQYRNKGARGWSGRWTLLNFIRTSKCRVDKSRSLWQRGKLLHYRVYVIKRSGHFILSIILCVFVKYTYHYRRKSILIFKIYK